MYSIGEKGLYINMYGGNILNTELHDGTKIKLEQITNYPWDGKIVIDINEAFISHYKNILTSTRMV